MKKTERNKNKTGVNKHWVYNEKIDNKKDFFSILKKKNRERLHNNLCNCNINKDILTQIYNILIYS